MKAQPGDELVFAPLGGCEEIGMNLNAYGYGPPDDRKWIIVDIGVTFGGGTDAPGIDLIMADPAFIEEERENLLGVVLTHAHEDHIGAIAWLWPRLKAPVWATPFTAALVREKLKERGLVDRVKLNEVGLKHRFQLGPFDIEYVTLTHSIPEPNGLAIRTPLGLVWHTGDWKIDPSPLIGETTDEDRLRALADEGVLAMVCDSTNVFVDGESGSEADVRARLVALVKSCTGRVAVTAFASNVARVDSAIAAARASRRVVCLVGRSMHKVVGAAKSVGLLANAPEFVSEDEATLYPPEGVLYLCTGSQGEERAALARIAAGAHRRVSLGEGDTVIFSSRVIPGNETNIYALYNLLAARKVEVITDKAGDVHVSGHPARDELARMYGWMRPKIAVPVHGEQRHLIEHAALARTLQVPHAATLKNGDVLRLAPVAPEVVDEAPVQRLFVDGAVLVEAGDVALAARRRMAEEGLVSVSVVVDDRRERLMGSPKARLVGLPVSDSTDEERILDDVERVATEAYGRLARDDREDDDLVEDTLSRAVRKCVERLIGKRPRVEVVTIRI
jgi:ribonuclease J